MVPVSSSAAALHTGALAQAACATPTGAAAAAATHRPAGAASPESASSLNEALDHLRHAESAKRALLERRRRRWFC